LIFRRTNRTEQCIEMLRRCVSLDPAYAPAFRVLARIATGPATGELLRHVIHLQPRNPDALAEYAYWLYKNGESPNKELWDLQIAATGDASQRS
jgi:Tfp pilus assembly protein PilF